MACFPVIVVVALGEPNVPVTFCAKENEAPTASTAAAIAIATYRLTAFIPDPRFSPSGIQRLPARLASVGLAGHDARLGQIRKTEAACRARAGSPP